MRINQLDFAVDQYIAIGSPLGLFLALRKVLVSLFSPFENGGQLKRACFKRVAPCSARNS